MDFDPCKYGDCRKQSVYYLVYACDNQHIADLKLCLKHLTAAKELIAVRKWRCSTCQYPLTKGIYKFIRPGTMQKINTRNLDGKIIRSIPNPNALNLTQAVNDMTQEAKRTTTQIQKIVEALEALDNPEKII